MTSLTARANVTAHSVYVWAAVGHAAVHAALLCVLAGVSPASLSSHRVCRRERDKLHFQKHRLLTGTGGGVTVEALGTAVLLIGAALGVLHGAAAVLAGGEQAAGVVLGAAVSVCAPHVVVRDRLHIGQGGELGVPGDHHGVVPHAGAESPAAGVMGRTAVFPVGAAHGLWQWTAAPGFA